MLKKHLQKAKRNSGFTIIEVLIVLAIAGLIMVVVFLAVPALNRNAHNNQYKTEANNLLAAYQELSNNNGGAVLTNSDATNLQKAANTQSLTNISISDGSAGGTASGNSTSHAVIFTGAKCAAQNSKTYNGTSSGATARNVALFYQIEGPGNTFVDQCIGE